MVQTRQGGFSGAAFDPVRKAAAKPSGYELNALEAQPRVTQNQPQNQSVAKDAKGDNNQAPSISRRPLRLASGPGPRPLLRLFQPATSEQRFPSVSLASKRGRGSVSKSPAIRFPGSFDEGSHLRAYWGVFSKGWVRAMRSTKR